MRCAVYTAVHGYNWSNVPEGLSRERLDRLLDLAMEDAPEFPPPDFTSAGVVSDGETAAVYTLREVENWDSVGRSAQYAAFAFPTFEELSTIDIAALLTDPFFTVPSHEPPAALDYSGPASTVPPLPSVGRLLCHNQLDAFDVSSIGSLLATYGTKSPRWRFMIEGKTCKVETAPWRTGGGK